MDYRDPEWIAERLGLDRNTVYKFLQEGTIPAVQLGRKWLVSEKALFEWLEQETQRQTEMRRAAAESSARTARRMDNFTLEAQRLIHQAHSVARGYSHHYLGQEHFLLAMAADAGSAAGRVLRELGLGPEEMKRMVEERVKAGEAPSRRRLGRDEQAKQAMRLAERLAREKGRKVSSLDLLVAIAKCGEGRGHEILSQRQIGVEVLEKAVESDEQAKE